MIILGVYLRWPYNTQQIVYFGVSSQVFCPFPHLHVTFILYIQLKHQSYPTVDLNNNTMTVLFSSMSTNHLLRLSSQFIRCCVNANSNVQIYIYNIVPETFWLKRVKSLHGA